ncbi:hypothetical protein QAD02_011318, partial [Eretmocerus hayati]
RQIQSTRYGELQYFTPLNLWWYPFIMDVQMDRNDRSNNRIGYKPSLEIIVQPVEVFRFRYEKETKGCYGRILGDGKNGAPTVQMKGCNDLQRIVIRCTLCCADETLNFQSPHRLIRKRGNVIENGPIDIAVSRLNNYTAKFDNMSIILVKGVKKNFGMRRTKNTGEQDERNVKKRSSTMLKLEKAQITSRGNKSQKSMNSHNVSLCFQGYYKKIDGSLYPLTDPVYSRPIGNSRNVSTGKLSIERMLNPTGSCEGGDSVSLMVDKVDKDNIQVRFCELDNENKEIWNGEGEFVPTDIFQRCVIQVRTPPYHDLGITQPKQAFIYLFRPSDGRVSGMRPFLYKPSIASPKQRHPRMDPLDQNSSNSSNGSTQIMSLGDLAVTRNSTTTTQLAPFSDPTNYPWIDPLSQRTHFTSYESSQVTHSENMFVENAMVSSTTSPSVLLNNNLQLTPPSANSSHFDHEPFLVPDSGNYPMMQDYTITNLEIPHIGLESFSSLLYSIATKRNYENDQKSHRTLNSGILIDAGSSSVFGEETGTFNAVGDSSNFFANEFQIPAISSQIDQNHLRSTQIFSH